MLDLLAKHGFFDLTVKASGDTHIDDHHTVEDIGIVLGEALKKALGKKERIRRFGTAWVPLDETLAQVTVTSAAGPISSITSNCRTGGSKALTSTCSRTSFRR